MPGIGERRWVRMIKSRKNIPIRAVFYVVILIFVMIQVYPIFWVICSSLKTPDEMTYTAQYALPSGFYLGNYISALTISSIPRYFLNSTVVAVLTLLGIVVLGCHAAGYPYGELLDQGSFPRYSADPFRTQHGLSGSPCLCSSS